MKTNIKDLINFLNNSKSPFHAVENIKNELEKNNFIYLSKETKWDLQKGGRYFVINNDNMLVAFNIPSALTKPELHLVASHCDSPTFKLKPEFEINNNNYQKYNTEPYGGAIFTSFMDRPLGIAGRVIVNNDGKLESKLVCFDQTVIIPNLAIHMNRELNTGFNYNPQIDMLPLITTNSNKKLLSDNVVAHDLFLYNKDEAVLWGDQEEFISSPHLDDLECVYASIEALCNSKESDNIINIAVVFNHEEVGSQSSSGAGANTLEAIIKKILKTLGINNEKEEILARSMLVSADNAHAVHPNHPEKSDQTNAPLMNNGIVIKHQAGLAYTTDAVSESIFKRICQSASINTQSYTNRSDIRGGSTLGSILLKTLPIVSVDIGLAQLAMHSSFETAGTKDYFDLVKCLETFFTTNLNISDALINK